MSSGSANRKRGLGAWTDAEDELLSHLVNTIGLKNWGAIEAAMPDRDKKQCRERWYNHVDPEINDRAFTDQESIFVLQQFILHGRQWARMSRSPELRGRPDNAIKNHFNTNLRDHYAALCKTLNIPHRLQDDQSDVAPDVFERVKDKITAPTHLPARGSKSSRFVAPQDDTSVGSSGDAVPSRGKTFDTMRWTTRDASGSSTANARLPLQQELLLGKPMINTQAATAAFAAVSQAAAAARLNDPIVARFHPPRVVPLRPDPTQYINRALPALPSTTSITLAQPTKTPANIMARPPTPQTHQSSQQYDDQRRFTDVSPSSHPVCTPAGASQASNYFAHVRYTSVAPAHQQVTTRADAQTGQVPSTISQYPRKVSCTRPVSQLARPHSSMPPPSVLTTIQERPQMPILTAPEEPRKRTNSLIDDDQKARLPAVENEGKRHRSAEISRASKRAAENGTGAGTPSRAGPHDQGVSVLIGHAVDPLADRNSSISSYISTNTDQSVPTPTSYGPAPMFHRLHVSSMLSDNDVKQKHRAFSAAAPPHYPAFVTAGSSRPHTRAGDTRATEAMPTNESQEQSRERRMTTSGLPPITSLFYAVDMHMERNLQEERDEQHRLDQQKRAQEEFHREQTALQLELHHIDKRQMAKLRERQEVEMQNVLQTKRDHERQNYASVQFLQQQQLASRHEVLQNQPATSWHNPFAYNIVDTASNEDQRINLCRQNTGPHVNGGLD